MQGQTGSKGISGPTGPKGINDINLTGPTGPNGIMGLMGDTGPTGSPGPMGLKGMLGNIGMTGGLGPVGPVGATGLSIINETGSLILDWIGKNTTQILATGTSAMYWSKKNKFVDLFFIKDLRLFQPSNTTILFYETTLPLFLNSTFQVSKGVYVNFDGIDNIVQMTIDGITLLIDMSSSNSNNKIFLPTSLSYIQL